VCHLCASLDSEAENILWLAGKQTTAEEVVSLPRSRFGMQNQCERYCAKLKSIRGAKRATLQSLANRLSYFPVRKALSERPWLMGPSWTISVMSPCAKCIMEKHPLVLDEALDEAFKLACHLEAISRPLTENPWDAMRHLPDKLARGASGYDDMHSEMDRCIHNLGSTLHTHQIEFERYGWRTSGCITLLIAFANPMPYHTLPPVTIPEVAIPVAPVELTGLAQSLRLAAANDGQRQTRNGNCFGCGQPGHRIKDCPTRLNENGVTEMTELRDPPNTQPIWTSTLAVRIVIVYSIRVVNSVSCPENWSFLPFKHPQI